MPRGSQKKSPKKEKKARFLCVRRFVGARKKRRGGKRGVPSSSVLPPPPSVFQFTSRKERSWRWEISLDFSLLLLSSKSFSPSKTDRKYFLSECFCCTEIKGVGKTFLFLFLSSILFLPQLGNRGWGCREKNLFLVTFLEQVQFLGGKVK